MAQVPDEVVVKIDVDSEEFVQIIDNIGLGFKMQGKQIRNLKLWNIGLTAVFLGHLVGEFVIR